MPFSDPHSRLIAIVVTCAGLHVALAAVDRWSDHPTANAAQGAAFLGTVRIGPLRPWRDGLLIGAGLASLVAMTVPELAAAPVLVGLFLYEWAYVRAGQLPPLS